MLLRLKLPKTLIWVINISLIFLTFFTLYRILTLLVFSPDKVNFKELISSFLLGLRYDLRWISIFLLPIVIASLIPKLSPYYSKKNKKAWTLYLAVITFILFFFFAADFGCFFYNKTRLNASALNFFEDPRTSAQMLWQSYPIVWMVVGLMVIVLLLRNMFRKLHGYIAEKTEGIGIQYQRKWFIMSCVLFGLFMYGSLNRKPLKWQTAFELNDSFASYLALNPFQNFFTTLQFRTPEYNETKVKESFPVMSQWMDLHHKDFSFRRTVYPSAKSVNTHPNVVLVLCESFSMYKSSMSHNPLNTTPYFNSLCDSGIFFNRCFTPHFSTARGLFATLTGIPDVQLSKFSTRNPEALNQHTIINNFNGYNKYYFLGGNPSFNNFEGLICNIDGVHMNTEVKSVQKPLNVWGISDKDLFSEANRIFSLQTKPFFAIVQTADNHRPFSISEDEKEFQSNLVTAEELKKFGFESLDEYNAFRYSDYCFKKFIESAKKEHYFENTIFVFVGDHGVNGNATNIYPSLWTDERLTDEHVPLLFYAPKLLSPVKRNEVVSQIDVLPAIAGLAGQTYENTTLGRDILNNTGNKHYAFIIHHDEGKIGIATDDYYFTRNLNFNKEDLFCFDQNVKLTLQQKDSIKRELSKFTTAFYETSKWMLVHNKQ